MSWLRCGLALLVLSVAMPAAAHPLSPAAVAISEQPGLHYAISFRRSERASPTLVLDLPGSCTRTSMRTERELDQVVDHLTIACTRSLEGQSVRVFGLVELSLGALVHVQFLDGRSVSGLLTAEHASFVLPARSSPLRVFATYVQLGIEHLLTGFDHLLFVLGLLLLVRGPRRLVATLTAFTLGHSVTLCLAALSLVSVPQAPVELGIALSLVVLALEVLQPSSQLARPWYMASAFGLLHGLGFAGALAETGLPQHAIPLSLFGFNLGVELGQLAVVLAFAPLLYLSSKLAPLSLQRLRTILAYGIGSLAAMWCIERALGWFV